MGRVVVKTDDALNMATYSFEGDTRYDDVRIEIDNYYSGKLTKYKICDFTNCRLDVSTAEVVQLADQVRTRGTARRQGFDAIVVPGLLLYGLARMYVAYAEFAHYDPEALKMMIFRTMDDAVAAIRRLRAEEGKT